MRTKPKAQEVEQNFRVNELFFSTTDFKGIIETGNEVFVKISGYTVEELVGAPHSIIRHPDMPRAVFRLLWEYIESKKIIVAYVKNMAANGCYYWVLALVYPLNNGYLSIRFKPTSKYFSVVKKVYEKMRAIENGVGDKGEARKQGMEEATVYMIESLKSLGFDSYDDFMQKVITEELCSRDLNIHNDQLTLIPTIISEHISSRTYGNNFYMAFEIYAIYQNFYSAYMKLNDFFMKAESFNQINDDVSRKANTIYDLAKDFRFISLNTAIQSEKLGTNSHSLSVVASNMEEFSKRVLESICELKIEVESFRKVMMDLIFSLSTSKLRIEMMLFFIYEVIESLKIEKMKDTDTASVTVQLKNRCVALHEAFNISFSEIVTSVNNVQLKIQNLCEITKHLNQNVLSLKFGQIEGLVEANRINQGSSFGVVFKDINMQLDKVKEEYSSLSLNIQEIKSLIVDAPLKMEYVQNFFEKSIRQIGSLS